MPEISRGPHCDKLAPRQYNACMAGNPRNPDNEPKSSLPGTCLTELIVEGEGQKDVDKWTKDEWETAQPYDQNVTEGATLQHARWRSVHTEPAIPYEYH